MITEPLKQSYHEEGYVVVRGLFSAEEAATYRQHYLTLRRRGTYPYDGKLLETNTNDPLKLYPRLMQMHKWDDTTLDWLTHPRINACMTALLGREPYAVQTMLYFKPPGSRGQALHQDNFYLRAQPGTCMAAWMALERSDEANGCMQVIPRSHTWPMLCTEKADTTKSFTDVTVPIPEDEEVRPVIMEPGDVLFFNGSLVHGSYPNTTSDRFRCSLIGHYIEGIAEQVSGFHREALRMDRTPAYLDESAGGGACGVWVDQDGQPVIEMAGEQLISRKHE